MDKEIQKVSTSVLTSLYECSINSGLNILSNIALVTD